MLNIKSTPSQSLSVLSSNVKMAVKYPIKIPNNITKLNCLLDARTIWVFPWRKKTKPIATTPTTPNTATTPTAMPAGSLSFTAVGIMGKQAV